MQLPRPYQLCQRLCVRSAWLFVSCLISGCAQHASHQNLAARSEPNRTSISAECRLLRTVLYQLDWTPVEWIVGNDCSCASVARTDHGNATLADHIDRANQLKQAACGREVAQRSLPVCAFAYESLVGGALRTMVESGDCKAAVEQLAHARAVLQNNPWIVRCSSDRAMPDCDYCLARILDGVHEFDWHVARLDSIVREIKCDRQLLDLDQLTVSTSVGEDLSTSCIRSGLVVPLSEQVPLAGKVIADSLIDQLLVATVWIQDRDLVERLGSAIKYHTSENKRISVTCLVSELRHIVATAQDHRSGIGIEAFKFCRIQDPGAFAVYRSLLCEATVTRFDGRQSDEVELLLIAKRLASSLPGSSGLFEVSLIDSRIGNTRTFH